jgi:archaellum biogenesis ATPase FlaH
MKYEFKEDDAYRFARENGFTAYRKGNELFFQHCPYCNGTGKGNLNTFSINLHTGQFKCLRASCGVSGNMLTLSRDYGFSLGNDIDEYYNPRKRYRKFKTPDKPIEPKPPAIAYLQSRGIPEEVARHYEITTQIEHENILVFPFYDEKGILQFVKYRKTDFNPETDNNKEWCEKNGKPILFGMKQCKGAVDRLIITEGQIDSLSVAAAGIDNAVSVPTGAKGFTWLPYCWNWVNGFSEVVIFGDYEKGNISLLDELSRRLNTQVRHVRKEDYRGCKDCNEILQKYGKEQVIKCVDNAELVPIRHIIDISEVEAVDINEIPKLRTGIHKLDNLFYGGLPFGGVTLITGKSGDGKSTFASQLLLNAVEQGHKCLAYSGELTNYLFKEWLYRQTAGNHVVTYKNSMGDIGYTVSRRNTEMINDWYRERLYLYDNKEIKGEEQKSLLKLVEEVIKQYGVDVILLDNLMTAIGLAGVRGSDKLERQSEFAGNLTKIARDYGVLVLLVAHKRKNNTSTNENDEVAGSSNITNLAMATITYERGREDKIRPDQRILKVSKNRLFGKTTAEGYILDYDDRSKRIYSTDEELLKEYGWMYTADFRPVDDMEIPF